MVAFCFRLPIDITSQAYYENPGYFLLIGCNKIGTKVRKLLSNIVYHCEVINALGGTHTHKHIPMHGQKQFQEMRCMSGSKSGEFTKNI